MNKLTYRVPLGTVGLLALVACQGAPPQQETAQEPKQEEAVVEESFETGDTGTLTSEPEESTETEEEPQGDSQ